MRWFKHRTDMSNNPKMRLAMKEHGPQCYMVWNVFLEEACRWGHETSIKPRSKTKTWQSEIVPDVIAERCFMSCADVVSCLQYLFNVFGVSCIEKDGMWIVTYCKILEIRDDYSKKKVRTKSGQSPKKVIVEEEGRTELDLEIKEQEVIASFDALLNVVPKEYFNPHQFRGKHNNWPSGCYIWLAENLMKNKAFINQEIEKPWPYVEKIFSIEAQNVVARLSEQEAEEHKE